MKELKPCPFCGSDNLEFSKTGVNWGFELVRCINCSAEGPTACVAIYPVDEIKEKISQIWNERI